MWLQPSEGISILSGGLSALQFLLSNASFAKSEQQFRSYPNAGFGDSERLFRSEATLVGYMLA